MGWRVKDAAKAYAAAIERGAPSRSRSSTGPMELRCPQSAASADSIIYLIDRYEGQAHGDLDL
jgi:4-hydroxyphenylpyruvate dioxygenase